MSQPISSRKHLRIATRKSPLALWQANHAREKLLEHWPDLTVELLPMTTSGDRFFDKNLLEIGGKGLFVKELETALLNHEADFAVHSMKDMPADMPDGLTLHTIFSRQNPLDAFVSNQFPTLNSLPKNAIIGTSSLRRASQLLALRPDLVIEPIRGNLGTRLKKLDAGPYHALILAAAGLERLQLDARIQETLPETVMLPAPGQGALGIECRADDTALHALLKPLHDSNTANTVAAERLVNKSLGGNCHTPIAIYCRTSGNHQLTLNTLIASPDGKHIIRDTQTGSENGAQQLAEAAVQALKQKNAHALLSRHE
jgi:hydroxymethylbilane synthase